MSIKSPAITFECIPVTSKLLKENFFKTLIFIDLAGQIRHRFYCYSLVSVTPPLTANFIDCVALILVIGLTLSLGTI